MEIQQRLKDIREDRELSQQEVADYLKIDRKTYCRYEKGHHEIKVDVLVKLAQYYNLSLDYITGITNVPEKLNSSRHLNQQLNSKQLKLIHQYEHNKEFQKAVDKLLDIND